MNHSFSQFKATREVGGGGGEGIFCYHIDGPMSGILRYVIEKITSPTKQESIKAKALV